MLKKILFLLKFKVFANASSGAGEVVTALVKQHQSSGNHFIVWNDAVSANTTGLILTILMLESNNKYHIKIHY